MTLSKASTKSWDVAIIGAGPAGAMAAYESARQGLSVLLIDKSAFPRKKVCGCCLNQHTLSVLKAAGLGHIGEPFGRNELKEIRLAKSRAMLRLPLPGGKSLSRLYFDAALIEAAQKAGACFMSQTKGTLGEVQGDVREVTLSQSNAHDQARAKVVLVSDGLAGHAVHEKSEANFKIHKNARLGVEAVFEDGGNPFYEFGIIYMACGSKGYAGLVRLEDGCLNIAAALDDPLEKRNRGGFPGREIARILEGAHFPLPRQLESVQWSGTPALTRERKIIGGERFFVLGDAAGYTEPFTGEGIAWAVDSAVFLKDLVEKSVRGWREAYVQSWESWYRKNIRNRQRVSRLISFALRQPLLLTAGFSFLAWNPGFAERWVRSVCQMTNR